MEGATVASATNTFDAAKSAILKYAGSLVMDKNLSGERVVSLGRLSATLVMAQCMWIWHHGTDIPQTMLQALLVLFGYNFGNKGVQVIQGIVDAKRATIDANTTTAANPTLGGVTTTSTSF